MVPVENAEEKLGAVNTLVLVVNIHRSISVEAPEKEQHQRNNPRVSRPAQGLAVSTLVDICAQSEESDQRSLLTNAEA